MNNYNKDGTVKFPKRRKSRDNPYTLGYCEQRNTYCNLYSSISGRNCRFASVM